MKFLKLFNQKKPLIGMIHLPPLVSYPKHPGMDQVIGKALKDLQVLEKAGFDGVLVENDNDQPHQINVSNSIKESFADVMRVIKEKSKIKVGMEIIYDMVATLEVGKKVSVDFIRLDVFVDDIETKWGKIYGEAKKIIEIKKRIKAEDLVIFSDIQVKHAKMLGKRKLAISAKEAVANNSDGVIVTGDWTGEEPLLSDLVEAKDAVYKKIPVIIGSGFSKENAKKLLLIADAAIVGTSIKTGDYIDIDKASQLMGVVRKIRAYI